MMARPPSTCQEVENDQQRAYAAFNNQATVFVLAIRAWNEPNCWEARVESIPTDTK